MISQKGNIKHPFVSVIVPCRNEEKFISGCLDSIIAQEFPKDKMEILVVDGMSEDDTRRILKKYQDNYSFIRILDNPRKITPVALNIGIRNARGGFIMKMDAHTTYKKDYISKCVHYLCKYNSDNVGGVLIARPTKGTLTARAIALSLSHWFGAGNSYFKTGAKGPKWVDAVAFGCFKKEVFEKVGPYDENMTRSQDMELNFRLRKKGGKILLVPSIIGYYYSPSNFKSFLKRNFIDGVWVTYPLRFGKRIFSWRHLVPLLFVSTLIGLVMLSGFSSFFLKILFFILILYFGVSVAFSFSIAEREKDARYLFLMPVVFGIRHIAYGFGSIYGLLKAAEVIKKDGSKKTRRSSVS